MKIYFSYGSEIREGYESTLPSITSHLSNDSIEEIQGQDVLEKVPSLIRFIEECYRILKPEGKAIFSSPIYSSTKAWSSPLAIRGISEYTLNFSSKDWREQNKYTEAMILANFEVNGQVAIEQSYMQRSDEARAFGVKCYNNIAQALLFTLTKKL